jgi:hypothetical protein
MKRVLVMSLLIAAVGASAAFAADPSPGDFKNAA